MSTGRLPLYVRAACLVRMLYEGRPLPKQEQREVLAQLADSAVIEVRRETEVKT